MEGSPRQMHWYNEWLDHATSRSRKQKSPDRASTSLDQLLSEPSGSQQFSASPKQASLICIPSAQTEQHRSRPSSTGQLNSPSKQAHAARSSPAQAQPIGDSASRRRMTYSQAARNTASRLQVQPLPKRSDNLPPSHPYELRSANSCKVSKN
ncbi:hypothetical protein MTO96_025968 [Rhipicephalus appendiculatus]